MAPLLHLPRNLWPIQGEENRYLRKNLEISAPNIAKILSVFEIFTRTFLELKQG